MPHYSHAPIVEAVIDLNASFGEPLSIEKIELFARQFKLEFPHMQRINALSMAVGHSGENGALTSNISSGALGVRMTNAIGDRVLQIRTQGLSYSHLPPYTNWQTFATEMKPFWRMYTEEFLPDSITRLAVRFINRITVPQGVDLDLYLNVTPRLLTGICPDVEGYFMQLVLPQRDLGNEWRAIVNTGIEAAASPDVMSVLLDIDLFCVATVPTDEAQVWRVLNQLRERKNEIFEAAITDRVRGMIQ